jgi:hypothetical protein
MTGVDLTHPVARNTADRLPSRVADSRRLLFPDGVFDAVWRYGPSGPHRSRASVERVVRPC